MIKPKKKTWVKALCIILAALMVLSVSIVLVQILSPSTYAATYYYDPSDKNKTNPLVTVGISHGSSMKLGYNIQASGGIKVGYANSSRQFTSIKSFSNTDVTVVIDDNLGYSGGAYYVTGTESHAVVGGYHVQVTTYKSLTETYETIKKKFPKENVYIANIDGVECVRVGQYTNTSDARKMSEKIHELGYAVYVMTPSSSTIGIIDTETRKLLFQFKHSSHSLAIKSASTGKYLKASNGYSYDGVLKFTRTTSSGVSGIMVINIVPLETYVKCVVPYEVGPIDNTEVYKTFAVAARSFVLAGSRHSNFDMCSSTCCQMYCGMGRVTQKIINAVDSTAGLVATYDGKIATTTYSSSVGGITVSASDAWKSSGKAYLTAVATPWEDYESVYGGSWKFEYSPALIKSQLNFLGIYPTGTIVKIKTTCAANSTYVKKITFVDSNGNEYSISGCDNIKSSLGFKSANFVVGKAGETVQVKEYKFAGDMKDAIKVMCQRINGTYVEPTPGTHTVTEVVEKERIETEYRDLCVLSEGSSEPEISSYKESAYLTNPTGVAEPVSDLDNVSVIDADGNVNSISLDGQVRVDNVIKYTETVQYEVQDDYVAPDTIIETTKTITLSGTSGSFIFQGRGYGHGVGLSQYGSMFLAEYGVGYQDILKIYMKGIKIQKFNKIT